MRAISIRGLAGAVLPAIAILLAAPSGGAVAPRAFLTGLNVERTIASTVPANGDLNPYGIAVAPVSSGLIGAGDLLVDNFNAKSNEQGTGTTVMLITPSGHASLFASIPRNLSGCPGGVGLSTALVMLRTGWVIVGSAPSQDGTTKTAGAGCLVVLGSTGKVAATIAGTAIDGPWDMAVVDDGVTANLFVTNALIGVGAPGQAAVDRGDLVRLSVTQSATSPPHVTATTVIANGFPEQANATAFVVGPTGVAVLGTTAYVADSLPNSIVAIPDVLTRSSSDGLGTTLTSGGDLQRPLGLVAAPSGDLLTANALNGNIVEVSPGGMQVAAAEADTDTAQSPPGNGDLFGLAVAGRDVYFVKDDTNTVALLY